MNILLSIIAILLCFTSLVIIEKLFKKEGLYCFMVFASITANILVCKNINILGYTFTLGNILFASNFLSLDILNEKYSLNDSRKGCLFILIFSCIFIISIRLGLLFIPDNSDIINNSLNNIFDFNLRVTLSSLLMMFLSNLLDVYLFDLLRKKYPNKLWLRNNISTIISNCLENFLFCFLAFFYIYNIKLILEISITTSIAEIIIALIDTPFLYLSKKLN